MYKGILNQSTAWAAKNTKVLAAARESAYKETLGKLAALELMDWDADQIIGSAMNQINFVSPALRQIQHKGQ